MLIHNSCIKTSAIKTNSFYPKISIFPLFFRITRQTKIQIRRKRTKTNQIKKCPMSGINKVFLFYSNTLSIAIIYNGGWIKRISWRTSLKANDTLKNAPFYLKTLWTITLHRTPYWIFSSKYDVHMNLHIYEGEDLAGQVCKALTSLNRGCKRRKSATRYRAGNHSCNHSQLRSSSSRTSLKCMFLDHGRKLQRDPRHRENMQTPQ